MNILIVSDRTSIGGATTFMTGMLAELSKTNNKINYIYFTENIHNKPLTHLKNIHYFPIEIKSSSKLVSLVSRLIGIQLALKKIRTTKLDFIYTDLTLPNLTLIFTKRLNSNLSGVPIYHHIHGSYSAEKQSQLAKINFVQKIKLKIFYILEHFSLLNCQKIIVNSVFSKNQTKLLHGYNLPIIVAKPGIDPSLSPSVRKLSKIQARAKLGLDPDHVYILCTSRIEPRKGVLEFFRSLPPTIKIPKNLNFILCTQFSQTPWLYSFFNNIDNTSIGSKLIMINSPNRTELALFYKSADITIMPSTGLETFGFTTLESYYYNTPVVAFDVAANPEIIPKNFLVKYKSPKDFKKLYQKAVHTIKTKPKIDYYGFNFSWKNYVDKLNR